MRYQVIHSVVSFVEADYSYHGKALTPEEAQRALEELGWR